MAMLCTHTIAPPGNQVFGSHLLSAEGGAIGSFQHCMKSPKQDIPGPGSKHSCQNSFRNKNCYQEKLCRLQSSSFLSSPSTFASSASSLLSSSSFSSSSSSSSSSPSGTSTSLMGASGSTPNSFDISLY